MSDNMLRRIAALSAENLPEVIAVRRDIHRHPELSFQEQRTAALVAGVLKGLNLDVRENVGGRGVTAVLRGRGPGKTVALRADMDALPVREDTNLPFSSCHEGMMHACGHDCHTANLLGVARILTALQDDFDGTVKFIFQHGEENGGGGREMVKAGVLEDPAVDAILAMHVLPAPLGYLRLGYGPVTAYSDRVTFTVFGKNAHTSTPQKGVDAIVIAAQLITALQTILSRGIDPLEGATFSLGQIHGGTAPNIVPDNVEIIGMMRSLSAEVRASICTNMEKIAAGVAAAMGGRVEFALREGYPSVINDRSMTDLVRDTALAVYTEAQAAGFAFGDRAVAELIQFEKPQLGAEDFGFYSRRVPACLYWVGAGTAVPLHSPLFAPDEAVFKLSMPLMASAALRFLREQIAVSGT